MKRTLNEMISDVVWHKTSLLNAVKILSSNKFRLTTHLGTTGDKYGEKLFYLSTARSLTSGYMNLGDSSVVLKLNGRSLGSNHKGIQIAYWSSMGDGVDLFKKSETDEMEDRVVSDQPYIKNASKHIVEVRVMLASNKWDRTISGFDRLGHDGKTDDEIRRLLGKPELKFLPEKSRLLEIRQLMTLCKKSKIPIKFYLKDTDLKTGRHEVPLTTILPAVLAKRSDAKFGDDVYRSRQKRMPYTKTAIALYKLGPGELVASSKNRKASGFYDFIRDNMAYSRDPQRSVYDKLSVEIHNNKTTASTDLVNLIKLIKKDGHTDLKRFVSSLVDKWERIRSSMGEDGWGTFMSNLKNGEQVASDRHKKRLGRG